jgi:glycosyltransferase involved in cell wall biosynthesis
MSSLSTSNLNTGNIAITLPSVPLEEVKCLKASKQMLKNVLHIINGEHFSGAERVQQLLGRGLNAYGFNAHFACLKDGKFASHAGLPHELIHSSPMRHRLDLRVIGVLRKLVTDTKAQILHAHTPRSAMVTAALARRLKLPWVYHVHSPTIRDSARPVINQLNGMIERRSLRKCNAIVCVSNSLREEMIRQGVDRSKIYVAANGVETREPIDTQMRMNDQRWKFGVVALFRPRKGLENLLDAFNNMCQASVDPKRYSLEVIGGFECNEYEHAIRLRLSKLEYQSQINLHGFVRNAPERIRELDLLVLPSVFGEGMPMVVLEAMASGIPVIATKVEGTPEVIREGIEGWLAEPNQIDDLARCMTQAVSSRKVWANLAASAHQRQKLSFSDTNMCTSVADIYRKMIIG